MRLSTGRLALFVIATLVVAACRTGDKEEPLAARSDLTNQVRAALLAPDDLEGSWCCASTERKFSLNDVCGVAHWDNSFLGDTGADLSEQNNRLPPGVLEYILVLQPGEGRDCFELLMKNAEGRPRVEFPRLGEAAFAFQDVDYPGFTQAATILTGDVIISVAFVPSREDFDKAALEKYARLALEKWELTLVEWE